MSSIWTTRKGVWTQGYMVETRYTFDAPRQASHQTVPRRPETSYRRVPPQELVHKLSAVEREDKERYDPLSQTIPAQKEWLAYEEEVREHGYPVVPDKYTTPYYEVKERNSKPHLTVEQLTEYATGIKPNGLTAPRSTALGPVLENDEFTRATKWIVGHVVEPSYSMQRSKNPLERLGGMFGEVVGGLALGALGAVESYFKPYRAWESLETMYRHPMETAYYLNTPLGRASIVGSIGASAAIGWLGGKIVGGIARADLGDELYGLKPIRVARRTASFSTDRYHYMRLQEDIVGELVPVKTPRKTVSGVVWKERVFPSGWHYRTVKTARASEPLLLTRIQPSREPVGPLASRIKVRAGGYRIYGPRTAPVESYVLMRYRVEETPVDLGLVRVIRRKPVIGRSTYAYRTIDYVELRPEGLFGYRIMFRGRKVLGHVMEKTVSEMGGTPVAIAPTRQGLKTGYWESIEFEPSLGSINLKGIPVRVGSRFYPMPLSVPASTSIWKPHVVPSPATRTDIALKIKPRQKVLPSNKSGKITVPRTASSNAVKTAVRTRLHQKTLQVKIARTTGHTPRAGPPPITIPSRRSSKKRTKRGGRARRRRRSRNMYVESVFPQIRFPWW